MDNLLQQQQHAGDKAALGDVETALVLEAQDEKSGTDSEAGIFGGKINQDL
jgi:hypothetical protein